MRNATHSESGVLLSIDGCPEYDKLLQENRALRELVVPILHHALGSDLSAPFRMSIQDTRDFREKFNRITSPNGGRHA